MINTQARELLDLYISTAMTCEVERTRNDCIQKATGMLNYTLMCGDLKPEHHAAEMRMVDLARAQFSIPRKSE